MTMSILHRVTGTGLYFGTLLIAYWLISAASSKGGYDRAQWIFGSFVGRLILFGYTWALIHHLIGGLKHFVWDFGLGFGPKSREGMAIASIALSVGLTLVVWVVGYAVR